MPSLPGNGTTAFSMMGRRRRGMLSNMGIYPGIVHIDGEGALTGANATAGCGMAEASGATSIDVALTGAGATAGIGTTTPVLEWQLTVTTTGSNQEWGLTIVAPTSCGVVVTWGDTNTDTYTTAGAKTHTYANAGTYTVGISGNVVGAGAQVHFYSGTAAQDARLNGTKKILPPSGTVTLYRTFRGSSLAQASMASDMFELCKSHSITTLHETFLGVTTITSIPTGLFDPFGTMLTANGFYGTFQNCTGITAIPENLFRYNTAVSTSGFYYTFSGCTGITAIPTDLFRYNTAVSTSGFYGTFYNCTALTTIPTDLFRYNTAVSTSGFAGTFNGCTGITAIPTDLFRYNTAVSTSGFYNAFYGCSALTAIPADLFRYNTAVSTSGFQSTFQGCSALTAIPADLFRYNTAALSFVSTFQGAIKLQERSDMFFAAGEESTRFLNKSVDFTNFHKITSFSGTKGTAPALWDCNFGTGTATKTNCWDGHSTATVDNYASIPVAWT